MKLKAVSLKAVNITFILIITILCLSLTVSVVFLANLFKQYEHTSGQSYAVSKATVEIQESSDFLTDEARLFILSFDSAHMDNYFYERNISRRRENAIASLSRIISFEDPIFYLNKALNESHTLEDIEIYSMKLVVEGKKMASKGIQIPMEVMKVELKPEDKLLSDEYKVSKAWLLLFSEEYMVQKQKIAESISDSINTIVDCTEELHQAKLEELKKEFYHIIGTIGLIFVFAFIYIILIRHLVIKPILKNSKNILEGLKLEPSASKEMIILTANYNEMFAKNEANEVLLRHKAEHDELTGLINRGAYSQVIKALENADQRVALILIDVDFFKLINDNYGHPVGDKVLQRVAAVLKENFRTSDYVARIGGDEFAVILTDCDSKRKNVMTLISVKMSIIKETLEKEIDGLPALTLSCGIEISNNGYNNTLYEHADSALYDVKRSGRNGFKFYANDMRSILSEIK